LKGKLSRKQEEAKKMTWYQCFGSIPPAPSVTSWPGEWRSKSSCKQEAEVIFHLAKNQTLGKEIKEENWFRLNYDANAGLTCGEMLSFGAPDLPGEQRFFNLPEHTWTSSVLEDDLHIFGFPRFSCCFKLIGDSHGHLAAKFCDVFPDGKSRLISYGVINLNHHKSNETPEELVEGQRFYYSHFNNSLPIKLICNF
jgi:predicted acyl esterase